MIESGRNYDPVTETPMFQTNAQAPLRGTNTIDKPYGFHDAAGSYDYGEIKRWVERLPVSSAKREAVFSENFLALLGKANVKIG